MRDRLQAACRYTEEAEKEVCWRPRDFLVAVEEEVLVLVCHCEQLQEIRFSLLV